MFLLAGVREEIAELSAAQRRLAGQVQANTAALTRNTMVVAENTAILARQTEALADNSAVTKAVSRQMADALGDMTKQLENALLTVALAAAEPDKRDRHS